MAEYELDIAADQIMHWLRDEAASKLPRVEVTATREYTADAIESFEAAGVSTDTDVASLVTVGTLEVRPTRGKDGWVLQMRVEDVVGPHVPDDESVSESPEDIDFEAFYTDFVAPDRGMVSVTISAETPQAKRRFDRIFADLIRDRHRGRKV
jgi:hypothetical protein